MSIRSPLGAEYYGAAGLPLHHLSYSHGRTKNAIEVYRAHLRDPIMQRAPDLTELALVIEYCEYFIAAPCWTWPVKELAQLRAQIALIRTVAGLTTWLAACRRIGIEPL